MSVTPGPTTGITIGTAAFPTLTAQPFGYEETNTRAGQTARKWLVTGLLKPSEWLALLDVYDAWRDLRIEDEPTETSGVVGATVNLGGNGPGEESWSSVACWFITAPSAEQSGAYLSASVELVDANEALEVILKAEEEASADEDLPNLGTITIGTTTLTLLKPVDAYATSPSMELTATGTHYIQGALVPYKIKDVEGITNLSGWDAIRAWYETQIAAVPVAGSYFPISSPTATAENVVVSGVKSVRYTVSIQLGFVL
jgi:hypothetical protein